MIDRNWRDAFITQWAFIVVVGFACYLSPINYVRFIAEDYWGEYATSAAFLIATALFILCFRLTRGDWLARSWYALFSLACFFVAMEEISWGQRIFGISTPEALTKLNNQNELTLHNLVMIERFTPYDTVVPVAVFAYGVLIGAADAISGRIRDFLHRIRFIYPQIYLAPTFLTAAYLVSAPIAKSSELGELLTGIGMVLLAGAHAHSRLDQRAPTPAIRPWVWGGFLTIVGLWLVGAYLIIPALIESAYNRESFEVFNDLLGGRSTHPVEKYLHDWAAISTLGLMSLALGALAVAPFVRRLWTVQGGSFSRATAPVLVICLLTAGYATTMLAGAEDSFIRELNATTDRATRAGQYDRANTLLSYLELRSWSPQEKILYHRALIHQANDRYDEAAALFKEALSLQLGAADRDTNGSKLLQIAEIYMHLDMYDEADNYWQRALALHDRALHTAESDEERAAAHRARAITYRAMNDHNEAITEYVLASRSEVLANRRKQIWLGIGEVLVECQKDGGRNAPRWDYGAHWDRVQAMSGVLGDGPPPDWCNQSW